ncbi:hypothetical protein ACFTSF_23255 [Kribbella sp. NPDC056951]|uniref:hypothetical protein n=1 Tax=Kribbella sp. NPDC056951 TaxID=3345978 RepID=UPI0036422228
MITHPRAVVIAAILVPWTAFVVWLSVVLGWLGAGLSVVLTIGCVVAYRKAGGQLFADVSAASESELSTSGLPTADGTVFLKVSATVHWQAAKVESYHADVAREFVLQQAREVTAKWRPAQYSLAQHELAARIGRPATADGGDLEVWATGLRLELPEAVEQHLAKMDEAHRHGLLWEVGAANENRVRSYLRDDALRTPASAVVWWLAQHDGSVERAVELAEVLTKLSRLATGASETDVSAESQHLIEAIQKLEEPARRPAAHNLADAFEQAGVPVVAQALREEYNLPTLRPLADPPPSGDSEAGARTGRAWSVGNDR